MCTISERKSRSCCPLSRQLIYLFTFMQGTKAKRILIGLVGSVVLLLGIAMIVLPGPAFIVIPAGLAILATQFTWARRWMDKAKEMFKRKRAGGSV